MIYTTLNRIHKHDPRKLLKYLGKTGHAPLAILDAVGLDDALWWASATEIFAESGITTTIIQEGNEE